MPDVFPQVGNLDSGRFHQFRVFAANVAGVGKPSEASEAFLCEKWTMAEPGKDGAKPPKRSFFSDEHGLTVSCCPTVAQEVKHPSTENMRQLILSAVTSNFLQRLFFKKKKK